MNATFRIVRIDNRIELRVYEDKNYRVYEIMPEQLIRLIADASQILATK